MLSSFSSEQLLLNQLNGLKSQPQPKILYALYHDVIHRTYNHEPRCIVLIDTTKHARHVFDGRNTRWLRREMCRQHTPPTPANNIGFPLQGHQRSNSKQRAQASLRNLARKQHKQLHCLVASVADKIQLDTNDSWADAKLPVLSVHWHKFFVYFPELLSNE